jgi:ferrous iron transport protein B
LSESRIARGVLDGEIAPAGERLAAPDCLLVIADATNLARNLTLVGEGLRRRLPTVVAVTMIDLAHRQGLALTREGLEAALGCEVVFVNARSGEGSEALVAALGRARIPNQGPPGSRDGLEAWAEEVYGRALRDPGAHAEHGRWTDRLDRVLLHPVTGLVSFAAVMTGLFWAIFTAATIPMDLIDTVFAWLGATVEGALPEGVLRDFLVGGVIGGIGATVIFLPQICLLFFLISLLEDTGYLARAALLMDRVLRPFGLPGHAFVPLLSSHACALPGIMSARGVPDRRERLATILVAPFMSCSARIPVYVLLTTLLFRDEPLKQAVAFTGCYALGVAAGLVSALIARRTILRGPRRPMAIELPTYKRPSLRTAVITTLDRGWMFLRSAGTNILAICIVLWWLSTYPKVDPPPAAVALHQRVVDEIHGWRMSSPVTPEEMLAKVEAWQSEADAIEARHALAQSFAGRIGRTVQPVFEPLGFDWQLSIGVITSFAAREVFVSTMAVMTTGHADGDEASILEGVANAKRDDGVTPIFTPAVAWALLVYYVLAMQCLPTLAVTARESGSVRWALLQLAWMTALAYAAAWLVTLVA